MATPLHRRVVKHFRKENKNCHSAPVLAYANFSLPFILEVDGSHLGLGTLLSQEQEGTVIPIAYTSRSLRPTEHNISNYSSMKLELFVVK